MEPHWDDLKIFLAVARAESLSGAGKRLNLDPATVGRRIARLETALGSALFVKSPQGYALSDGGQRLMSHAEQAEQAMQAASEALVGQSEGLSGQIRIGAPDGCANFLLPHVCGEILETNPELDIQIVALPRVFNLSKREADMAVAVSTPQNTNLDVQKLVDYRLSLVGARHYMREMPVPESLTDLAGWRLVGYIPDMIFDSELDYLSELGLKRVAVSSNSVSVQLNLIQKGAGIGIVHDFALPYTRALRRVLPEKIQLTRSFYLIRHDSDKRSARLNRFAALLTDGMRREVARLEALT